MEVVKQKPNCAIGEWVHVPQVDVEGVDVVLAGVAVGICLYRWLLRL